MKRFFLAFLLLSGCALAQMQQPETTVPPPSQAVVDAVYETVARYQINTWQMGASVYCFRVRGEDADRHFLDRLKPLPVKPMSDCKEKQTEYTTTVIDKHTKKRAVMFGLGTMEFRTPTEALVQGSYMCGNQCMSGGIYHVALDGNQWKVTKFEVRISQ